MVLCDNTFDAISTCVLIVTSIIFLVMSFINLGIGLWIGLMTVTLSPVFRIPEHQNMIASDSLSQIESATILAFCCSIGLIAVAAMGYSTATCVRDVKGCFYGFIVLMLLIVGMQSAAAGLSYSYMFQFEVRGENFFRKTLIEKYVGPFKRREETSNTWDLMQLSFHCCGVKGQTIYQKLTAWNRTWINSKEAKIPLTCCMVLEEEQVWLWEVSKPEDVAHKLVDPNCPVTTNKSYTEGCFDEMRHLIWNYQSALISCGIILGIVEIITIFAASCIFPRVESDPDESYSIKYKRMGSDQTLENVTDISSNDFKQEIRNPPMESQQETNISSKDFKQEIRNPPMESQQETNISSKDFKQEIRNPPMESQQETNISSKDFKQEIRNPPMESQQETNISSKDFKQEIRNPPMESQQETNISSKDFKQEIRNPPMKSQQETDISSKDFKQEIRNPPMESQQETDISSKDFKQEIRNPPMKSQQEIENLSKVSQQEIEIPPGDSEQGTEYPPMDSEQGLEISQIYSPQEIDIPLNDYEQDIDVLSKNSDIQKVVK